MTAPVRGFGCPCGGAYRVTTVRKPSRCLVVRYRRCVSCGARVVTEERLSRTRTTSPAADSPTARTPPDSDPSREIG